MAGSRGLLKLSQVGKYWQAWKILASLENTGSGTGGYVFLRITVWSLMATFDNSYRKCYNKCNDDNKKAICHQTGKNASVKRFCLYGYKIPPNARKRHTANLHKFW